METSTSHGDVWNRDLIGVDPRTEVLSVGIVVGDGVVGSESSADLIAEFTEWGWQVDLLEGVASEAGLRAATRHDVVLFYGTRGSRGARRALCRRLPTVAMMRPEHGRGLLALVREVGRRRTTSVLVVHSGSHAKVLRRVSPAALVHLADPVLAVDLGAVLMRARAWWR